jgi:predicted transport protein
MKFTIDSDNEQVKIYTNVSFDELNMIKRIIESEFTNIGCWAIIMEEEKQPVSNDYYKNN